MSVAQPLIFNVLRLVALAALVLFLDGCAALKPVQQNPEQYQTRMVKDVERSNFPAPRGEDVIGSLVVMRLATGDTLPDVARHFSLGINAISAANPGVDMWVPEAGRRVVLPLAFILPDAPRKGIVINVATMRLFQFKGNGQNPTVSTYPVGVGTRERPTPTGQMRVERKAMLPTWHVPASIAEDHRKKGDPLPAQVPPGPQNPLGECALYLSKAGYLIHGTNKPASIGLKATNGCMRLYPENVKTLFEETPVNTSVAIVDQPYLVGQRKGVLYLEAHVPLEGSGAAELERIREKLRRLEKKSGRTLDWKKIEQVQTQALGIPVPIAELVPGSAQEVPELVEAVHPEKLYGVPQIPELRLDGWYVLAASVREEKDAATLAAIINHQGPPIPARVLPKSESSYRVIAGPFRDAGEAREAVKRLKIDLEIEGILIEPVQQADLGKKM
ncbi:L,D-transpeptidase family protein [Geomonas sp. RF6]|uniref:L,D-transpeptidase family protein n=1 Tax=Geomonas sp. RF6 TaxID=2897342 RepID=UPI001E492A85|nr:L,D-transpeptidase family protein [Geomonas sp. RF6]UFS71434.1 L,D-transpeptidase family protein [Geomonas sp. RF6]